MSSTSNNEVPENVAPEGLPNEGSVDEGAGGTGTQEEATGSPSGDGDGDFTAEDAGSDVDEVYRLKSHKRAVSAPTKQQTERRRERREPAADSANADEPGSRRKSTRARAPRKTGSNTSPPPEDFENLDPEERERRELEARLDAALAPASRKRKKLTADDIEMLQDDAIAKLRDDMRNAALQDVECIQQSTPAVNKVRMLPEVVRTLQKSSLADSILDGNLLESVRIWLEPLPDASLPSFEIQKALFQALITLPIKTIHLRESGLGRVVLFYQRSKRPHPQIKRLAQKLIGDWTRPIIGRSDNYRDKRVVTAEFDPSRGSALMSGKSRPTSSSSYEESANRRGRAAIPSQLGVSYNVAPVSNVQGGEPGAQAKDSQLRRMKTKLMANRARGKKSQVSVEGKELH